MKDKFEEMYLFLCPVSVNSGLERKVFRLEMRNKKLSYEASNNYLSLSAVLFNAFIASNPHITQHGAGGGLDRLWK